MTDQDPYGEQPAPYPQNVPRASSGYPADPYGQQGTVTGYPRAYPSASYPVVPASGRKYWALMFLVYAPLGAVIALVVALVNRGSARRTGQPLEIENANAAANFICSFLIYVVVLYGAFIGLGIAMRDASGSPGGVIIVPGFLLFAVGIWALVMLIMGTIKSATEIFNAPGAIRFFRD